MDRTAFAHSRALVTYSDGGRTGTCSIHCAVEHLGKSPGRQRRSLEVADYYGRELIDAESAVWVVGGGKSGVMTSPAKWAFAREERARRFVRENGGSITSFQAVLQAIKEEVAEMEKPPQLEQE
jgi:predicted Rossmann-fold nucleotide-binding protein